MKTIKVYRIILMILLVITLSLPGCSQKVKETEEPVNISAGQENNETQDASAGGEEDTPVNTDAEAEPPKEAAPDGTKTEPVKTVKDAEPANKVQKPEKSEDVTDQDKPEENPPTQEAEAANTLKIQGSVTNKIAFTLDELKSMKDIIFEDEFYSLNSFGTTGHTRFKGVKLWSLLERKAKLSSKASKITVIAADGYRMEFTLEEVMKQDYMDETNPAKKFPMIIAWEEKGQEYDPAKGAPYKLVVGQREAGDVNKPQWVSNIDRIIVE